MLTIKQQIFIRFKRLAKVILVLFILFSINSCNTKKNVKDLPFYNTNLSIEERVNDLVERLTLEEKVSQMMNASPAIERLGIPEYNWWNECLHGVARAGLATVFPQAIGLGATWDEDLMFRVSTAISDEARAKHHDFEKKGKRFIYQGLTFWSPNINIFRDPRWGRGQETYGEDPFLTGKLGVQFIKGLQGDDPEYFKTIATVKHYAVHSGPEPERHRFDAQTDERDLKETYLPQFEMGIKEGKAYSVMCAYNRYNGEACCGSNHLLNGILRDEWNFDGYVVSDCGAITDIYKDHKVVATPEEAASLAVKSGTDLECATVYGSLVDAVKNNLIDEQEIDIAVKRLFTARFKLGMFDPPEMVKYTNIPYSVVDSKEHRELALESARKSIVLLKNENNILPLNKEKVGTVAVIGPNSDQWLMLLGNYNGVPADPVTPLRGIKEKLGDHSKVLYAQGSELAEGMPMFEMVSSEVLFNGNENGLKAEYYNNKERSGNVLYTETVDKLDANWYNKAPREDMDDDNFGVRWTGDIVPELTGKYRLGIITSCKVDFYLNDSLILNTAYHFRDEYGDPRLKKSEPIFLEAGKKYALKIEAGESYADAQVQLVWAKPRTNPNEELRHQAVETAKKADLIVLCMGLSASLEGEQLDIEIEGFRGGDRTRLDLPYVQQQLIKEIYALGKPVVLVLLNGSALAINWENEKIPAVLEAWYTGQAAGQAIADVLFGDYNPGGRLPVTFYKSAEDLPSFEEYRMVGQTYRYFKGEPLYPFGYGLSYTTFRYNNLNINKEYHIGDLVEVAVDVTNTGKMAGDEVVQLYVSNLDAKVPVPIRTLKGFKRVNILPGETKTVHFLIPSDAFSIIDNNFERVTLPGRFDIFVGGTQPQKTADVPEKGILKSRITLL
ncbi:MAG: glycoside hydrolase family 3 C-terminal domain-containing protein [Bacteroidales bacterium]|nr:glycoside hydrolase family 3 C-terminal domain-containing protein [Bacteroidales bacterium]